MDKKLTVITGASSYVMDQLIDRLIETEYQVIAVSRQNRKNESRKNVKWISCNIADKGQNLSFLKNADVLFHAAAISKAYHREEYLFNNYQSTINIVEASKKYRVKKIVYISSILAGYDFGDYGLSKIKSEEYVRQNFSNWLIIRPSQLYGYSLNNPIDKLIDTIRKKKTVWCPAGDRKGIYPLYYRDMVQYVFESSVTKDYSNSIKVITGPIAYNYKGLINEIAGALNRKIIILSIPSFVILTVWFLIKNLKLKLGVYPDQLYRFYHNNTAIDPDPGNGLSISEYLNKS